MTLSDFFFNISLYDKISITEDSYEIFTEIITGNNKKLFNGYNPKSKVETSFIVVENNFYSNTNFIKSGGYRTVEIKCKRTDDKFIYHLLWNPEAKTLEKIGQYPTVADFHISEIKQYSKLLPKEKLKEFTRAIGLAANGVGIGSFVYLRRIFEHLIFESFTKAVSENNINEQDYQKARMNEKIDLLKTYLPSFLVENKNMYAILSLGIHELDEQTCLANFDTLRVGIEIILDEKLDELRKQEKIALAKQKLANLNNEIKK